MKPTYSVSEIKSLLRFLETAEIDVLVQVCNEEAARYSHFEMTAINRMIVLTKKKLSLNELQLEYLLSFN